MAATKEPTNNSMSRQMGQFLNMGKTIVWSAISQNKSSTEDPFHLKYAEEGKTEYLHSSKN